MDGRILAVGINEDKPIASQKVDGMVGMHMTPWFLWKYPGVVCCFGWLFLVFGPGSTPMAGGPLSRHPSLAKRLQCVLMTSFAASQNVPNEEVAVLGA